MRHKLNHLPLEPYKQRYTESLHSWEQRSFGKTFNVNRVLPTGEEWAIQDISSGEVLDSVRRPVWAMRQVEELLKQAPVLGHCWFSDFFHPGLEALPYSRSSFRAFSFLWAQSFDRYDFTTKFIDWMRPWEVMAFNLYEKVFVASDLLKELIESALPHVANKIVVVGLPFDHSDVFRRLGNVPQNREFDCVYTSRFDQEKDPGTFLELVDKCPELRFAICTGHAKLRGTDGTAVRRANQLAEQGRIKLFENCSKEEYYHVLASTKVQFNSALQDWVSFTLLEALTFGCLPLYPNDRSFPSALDYQQEYLYKPGNVDHAKEKLMTLLDNPPRNYEALRATVLQYHSETLNRIAKEISQ
jgi:hypothetical protein